MSFPAIILNEMQTVDRPVPKQLYDCLVDIDILQLRADSFLFTTPLGTRFHYHRGNGIAVAQGQNGTPEETGLFLNGTVYGAVAWLNGLIPLHASCVVKDGRAIAFTGDSGEGKSTLAAALARHGYSHRSDDVLLLEMRDDEILAWPDRDRIKLCDDAFALTGARKLHPIEPGADKYFAELPTARTSGNRDNADKPLPLTDLIVLASADLTDPRLSPCIGTEKLPLLLNAMYRAEILIGLGDDKLYRTILARLGTNLRIWRLDRKRDRHVFEHDVTTIARQLSDL